MDVQVNASFVNKQPELSGGGATILLTPPLDEDYWLFRVPVSETQAVVAFPKFFTIGIGFQHEEDWNTNLPYTCTAEEIYNHIAHNAAGAPRDTCLEAICAIQEVAARYMAAQRQAVSSN